MDESHNDYAILATASRPAEGTRVLKSGDTFALFDAAGDILRSATGEQGLYHDGTRFLSRLELFINGRHPLLLSSNVRQDNDLLVVDLTNSDMSSEGVEFPGDILHIFRSSFLHAGICYHRIRISNYGLTPRHIRLSLQLAADYADIFEVRGTHRQKRGQLMVAHTEDNQLVFEYVGLDGVHRATRICCSEPVEWLASTADFAIALEPQSDRTLVCTIACEIAEKRPAVAAHDVAFAEVSGALTRAKADHAQLETSNGLFNDWIRCSIADLHMMISPTPWGLYPYAGVPWFSTPFGRDGIITALELLWLYPAVARGVLGYLAATQATHTVSEQDAQPGKILHETRGGEMAALGEIPFGRYYGSVDATPLFIVLAGAYYERTADLAFIGSIWPSIERALQWIDEYGDPDRDGFVEYMRQTPEGLAQQGWKDSRDSVFHEDGVLAPPPIALCEVQSYVYAARCHAATLAQALGMRERAEAYAGEAERLRERFERAFWDEGLSMYVLALDGNKRPCRVRTSNVGHTLFGGIASAQRAARVADVLLGEDMYSGWGIRTLSTKEVRYNPMSYHNGSIWPHDNAMIAMGLGRYSLTNHALQVLQGLYHASAFMDLHRLPELFCGFRRRPSEAPTLYPVACAPQSWAAGAVFMLLQGCIGLAIDAGRKRVTLKQSRLPDFISWMRITDLQVGSGRVDIELERHASDVTTKVLKTSGGIEIVSIKG